MDQIEKIPVVSVSATPITHHRELPPGHYMVELSAFGSRRYLLWEMNSGDYYLILWRGKRQIFREFIITTEGGVINEEQDLLPDPD